MGRSGGKTLQAALNPKNWRGLWGNQLLLALTGLPVVGVPGVHFLRRTMKNLIPREAFSPSDLPHRSEPVAQVSALPCRNEGGVKILTMPRG